MKNLSVLLVLLFPLFVSAQFSDPSPWPEIRKKRIATLLPSAMKAAKVDAWLVVCRENNNDPLADHVGCENAGQTAVFLFFHHQQRFHSMAFSPAGEATALKDNNLLDEIVPVERSASAIQTAADFIRGKNFSNIAINMSSKNAQADGISFTQYQQLTKALGETLTNKLTTSDEIIYQWLSIKLPEEIAIMGKAAAVTAQWQIEAYQQIIPGVTTDADVAQFLKAKMRDAGVGDAWAAAQNPNVNSGTDRGHSHATDKIIQPGDVIQTDFGIRVYDRWVTDIQRFAYVLKKHESQAPEDIQGYWENAKLGRQAAFSAMKPGVKGIDIDTAQRNVMEKTGSLPLMWSTGHPVGYVAHDPGPNLGGASAVSVRPASQRLLVEGMTFAFDGFYSWLLADGQPKTISVEEMVHITDTGAEYLIPPQQNLVLVESK